MDQPTTAAKVERAADLTVRAFAVLRHLLREEFDAANDVLNQLDDDQGCSGMLALTRAIALNTMDIASLRETMAAADPGDAAALADDLFLWFTPDGVRAHPQGRERDIVIAGLRFMIMCADESRYDQLRHDFLRQYQTGEELPNTISGLLTVTLMAIQRLPESVQQKLATFAPDATWLIATARAQGKLPT